jgi:lysophospholipase L1-like esterase
MSPRLLPTVAIFLLASALEAPTAPDEVAPQRIDCSAPVDLVRLDAQFSRLIARIQKREAVTIVAIGSSSTAGAGASRPETTYPSRLQAELRAHLPGIDIRVLNRGVGGEDAREMLARFDRDMRDEHPDLVLWQLGTNALLRNDGITPQAALIREGLSRIRETGADVVLIDPQYAPKVLRDPDAEPMVALLSLIAQDAKVPVFHRFALMRHWRETREIPFETILSPDLFHMNDWSYGCLATNLANAIVEAVKPQRKLGEQITTASANRYYGE